MMSAALRSILKLVFCVTIAAPAAGFAAIAALTVIVFCAVCFITWDMPINIGILHSIVQDMSWVKARSLYLVFAVIGVAGWFHAGR